MTDYQKIDLEGPTAVGDPAPLPGNLLGLADATLADLSAQAASDPALDQIGYWPVTKVRPTPAVGHVASSSYTRVVDTEQRAVTVTYQTDPLPLAERKIALKAAITAEFNRRRDGGTTATLGGTPVVVSTTHDAAVELDRAIAKITRTDPAGTIPVVTRGKARVTLTAAIATAMLQAIEDHVALCQARENALYGLVDAAESHEDLDAIDYTTGWPS